MISSLPLKLAVLLALLAGFCLGERARCDHDDDETGADCRYVLPSCLEYEYVPDNQNPGRYIFSCLACTEGMVPYWTFNNMTLAGYYRPTNLPDRPISMCVPNSEGKPVRCTSRSCYERMFPFCSKFQAINPEYTVANSSRGSYRCLECEEHFEPVPTPIYTVFFETDRSVNGARLCTRKQGIFPCGTYCQAEFPGCARIQISKVQGGSSTATPETAVFRCLEAAPGWVLLDQNVEGDTTLFYSMKITALPAYISDIKKCDSRQCMDLLPNCELYFKEHKDNIYETYYCKKCKYTMKPRSEGVVGYSGVLAFLYSRDPLVVCDQIPLDHATCDEECKLEFPGCDILSTSNLTYDPYNGTSAVYTCNKCAEGFVPFTNTSSVPSWVKEQFATNVKVLCIPVQALQPTPVRGDLTNLLPKCLQYTSELVEYTYNKVFSITCVQCEQGWEPVGPVGAHWFSPAPRHVCRHIALSNPVQCNEDCKQDFPHCNSLMISRSSEGTPIYECLECSNGFYPIPYERERFGRLSNKDNERMNSNKIFLCSEVQEERYFTLTSCVSRNMFGIQAIPCGTDDNCSLVAYARDLTKGSGALKCLECKAGYRIKSPKPWAFSADPTFCEKIPNDAGLGMYRLTTA